MCVCVCDASVSADTGNDCRYILSIKPPRWRVQTLRQTLARRVVSALDTAAERREAPVHLSMSSPGKHVWSTLASYRGRII